MGRVPLIATTVACITALGCVAEQDDLDVHGHEHQEVIADGYQITGANLPAGTVSLTYDDGPGRNTLPIAYYLWQQGIQATFFVNGCRFQHAPTPTMGNCNSPDPEPAYYHPWVLSLITQMGHRVANHTQDHVNLGVIADDLALDDGDKHDIFEAQLLPLQTMLDGFIHDELYLIRSGGGSWSAEAARLIDETGDLSKLTGQIYWLTDPQFDPGDPVSGTAMDYACLRYLDPEACAEEYLDELPASPMGRGIILLHDRHHESEVTSDTSKHANTLRLTKHLVAGLRARGYTFVPLDATPGVLSARRFEDNRTRSWTSDFSDAQRWNAHVSYYGSLRLANVDGRNGLDVCGRGSSGIHCALSNGAGFDPMTQWTSDFSDGQGYRHAEYGATVQFGDLDGDGDDDVCVRGNTGVRCALSRADEGIMGFGPQTMWTQGSDFSDATGWNRDWSNFASIRLGHINRDGRADLCARGNSGIVCAENVGGEFGPMTPWKSDDFGNPHGYQLPHYGQTLQLGDIDRDGLADVCVRATLGIRCALNRGGSFGPSTEWTHGPFSNEDEWRRDSSYRSIHFADMNGDGDQDICGRAETGVVCAFADSGEFRTYQYLMNRDMRNRDGWAPAERGGTVMFGDVDGDGIGDVCGRTRGGIRCSVGTAEVANAR